MNILSTSKFRAGLFAAVLAVAPLSPALHAQDVGMIGKMNVPFAFETTSGHHFNPGVYSIRMDSPHTMLIRGDSDSALTMAAIEDNGQPAKNGKATFRRYGSQYFLSEITVAGRSRRRSRWPRRQLHPRTWNWLCWEQPARAVGSGTQTARLRTSRHLGFCTFNGPSEPSRFQSCPN
jgi:hypothetical protein